MNAASQTARAAHERPPIRKAIMRKRELRDYLSMSVSTIDRARAAGAFPAPIRLGVQAIGWRIEDVEAWLASRELKETH